MVSLILISVSNFTLKISTALWLVTFTLSIHVKLRSPPTAISKQLAHPILSISPVREEECEAKRKPGNELQGKMERIVYCW